MSALNSLPNEILLEIISYLMMSESISTILSLIHTCSTFRSLLHNDSTNNLLWNDFTFSFTHDFYRMNSANKFISQWKVYVHLGSEKDLIVDDSSEIKIARMCYEKFVDYINILLDGHSKELVRKLKFDNTIRMDGSESGWLQERLSIDFPNLTELYLLGEKNFFSDNSSSFPHLKCLEIPSSIYSNFALNHISTLEYLKTGPCLSWIDCKRLDPKEFFYKIIDRCYVDNQQDLDLMERASNLYITNSDVHLKWGNICNNLTSLTITKHVVDLSEINFPKLKELTLERTEKLECNNLEIPSLKSLFIDTETLDISILDNLHSKTITDIRIKAKKLNSQELAIIEDEWPKLNNITLLVEFNVIIQLRYIKKLFISRTKSICVVSDTIEKCTIFSSCSMQSTIRRIDYLEIHSLEQIIINDMKLEVGTLRLLNYNLVLYKETINKKLLSSKISRVDEIVCECDEGEYLYSNDSDFDYLDNNNSRFLTKLKLKDQKGEGLDTYSKLVEITGYTNELAFDAVVKNNITIQLEKLHIPKMKEIPLFKSVTVLKLNNSKIEDLLLSSLPNLKILEIGRSQNINSITISSLCHKRIEYIHIYEIFWLHIRAFLNTPNLKEFLIWKCDFMDGSEIHHLDTPKLLLCHYEIQ